MSDPRLIGSDEARALLNMMDSSATVTVSPDLLRNLAHTVAVRGEQVGAVRALLHEYQCQAQANVAYPDVPAYVLSVYNAIDDLIRALGVSGTVTS